MLFLSQCTRAFSCELTLRLDAVSVDAARRFEDLRLKTFASKGYAAFVIVVLKEVEAS